MPSYSSSRLPTAIIQGNQALVNRLTSYGAEIQRHLEAARHHRVEFLNSANTDEHRLLAASREYSHWQLAQAYLAFVYRLALEVMDTDEEMRMDEEVISLERERRRLDEMELAERG